MSALAENKQREAEARGSSCCLQRLVRRGRLVLIPIAPRFYRTGEIQGRGGPPGRPQLTEGAPSGHALPQNLLCVG